MKLVFCTDVVNGYYPLPSVLLWGYNLVHDQTRSGQASCNWHKMSGQAQQSGEDHTIQIRVLNSYFCHKLKIRGKSAKILKSYHVTTENNNKILTILVSIRSFLLQQIPHRKGSPDISKHIRGSKVSHKNTNWAESFDNLGVPLHKPSACNNPKTPLSLALHLFNRDSTKTTICQDLSGYFNPPLVQGDGQDWSPPPQPEKIVPYVPNFRQISGMSSSSIKESLEPRLEPTSCLAWNSL